MLIPGAVALWLAYIASSSSPPGYAQCAATDPVAEYRAAVTRSTARKKAAAKAPAPSEDEDDDDDDDDNEEEQGEGNWNCRNNMEDAPRFLYTSRAKTLYNRKGGGERVPSSRYRYHIGQNCGMYVEAWKLPDSGELKDHCLIRPSHYNIRDDKLWSLRNQCKRTLRGSDKHMGPREASVKRKQLVKVHEGQSTGAKRKQRRKSVEAKRKSFARAARKKLIYAADVGLELPAGLEPRQVSFRSNAVRLRELIQGEAAATKAAAAAAEEDE